MTDLINEIGRILRRGFPGRRVLLFLAMLMASVPLFAQDITVTGKVTDAETGEAMIGLNVIIKGTIRGVVTNVDGVYTMANCPSDAVLEFSFLGYEPQEVPVQGRTTIDISMAPASEVLEEIVVIGYEKVRRRDVTGAIASVQGNELTSIPVASAAEALTGKMAGVHVMTTEGSPDADVNIRVRGGGSITQSNQPLFIVDGFPVASISDIPSSEIQSIDVLKDASSTAIYGSRGAYGVFIITTKSGTEGKTRVTYNTYYGFKKVADHLTSLTVEDYVKWQYEYALLADDLENYEKYFGLYQDIDMYNGQPSINWYDQVFGHIGTVLNHDLNITGGSDKSKYSVSYAGINSNEIMLGSKYSRDNLSLKFDNKPNDKVQLAFSMRYSNTEIDGGGAIDQSNASPSTARLKQAMIFGPIPFTAMGDYDDEEVTSSMVNPIDGVWDNDRLQLRTRYTLGGSFDWEILKNLNFRTEAGLEYYIRNDDRFYGLTTYYVKNTPSVEYQNEPAVESYERKSTTLRSTNTLNYDFEKLLGDSGHSLKLLVGQEVIVVQSNTLFNQIWGFPVSFSSDEAFNLVSEGFSNDYTNTYNPDNKLLSFFGRLSYDYRDKYILQATFRADGSSKFIKENRWGYFPSVSLAWRITEEDFMKSVSSVVNNLKLRVSYGTAGNNDIPSNQIAQLFEASSTAWINGFSSFWSPKTQMANPDLKWETTHTRNIGLDFGLFKNRINGNVELYLNSTKDLLIEFPVSGTGYNTQYRNMGETQNKGLEITINAVIVNKKNYGLDLGFNIGFNKNEIMSLGVMNDFTQSSGWASTEINDDYVYAVGSPIGEISGFLTDGRYEVSDFEGYDEGTDMWILKDGVADNSGLIGTIRPGSIKLKDLYDDPETTADDGIVNQADCTVLGNNYPVHSGGLTINGRLYGFDLTAVFNWVYGNKVYNANKVEYTTARYQFRNMIDVMADGKRWTNVDASGNLVNDAATLEAMNANTTMWSPYMARHLCTDWAVEDGSFIRLSTLSLGYTIPAELVKKANLQNLRIYVSAYNLFKLTNYTGFDPEVSTRRNTVLTPGLDYSAYPKSRQVLFGLNLTF